MILDPRQPSTANHPGLGFRVSTRSTTRDADLLLPGDFPKFKRPSAEVPHDKDYTELENVGAPLSLETPIRILEASFVWD